MKIKVLFQFAQNFTIGEGPDSSEELRTSAHDDPRFYLEMSDPPEVSPTFTSEDRQRYINDSANEVIVDYFEGVNLSSQDQGGDLPNAGVICILVHHPNGDVLRAYTHPNLGLVPKFYLEDGSVKTTWPYQDEVGGVWVVPHLLPDGSSTPMCYVEPSLDGGFQMGDADSQEKDRKIVEVEGGFMQMYPVTVSEWNRFCVHQGKLDRVKSTRETRTDGAGGYEVIIDVTDHPVTNVSFYDAKDWADWAGLTLPSEEEWERAARGNDGRIYPWGNETPNDELCCSSIITTRNGTDPVTAHPKGASPYGIREMSGNVWEWTRTFF